MSGAPPVEAYLARLRRRAAMLHALRAAVGAVGAGAMAFALGALVLGPVGDLRIALAAWLAVLVATAAVVVWAVRAFAPWRGAGAARLLAGIAPSLPSAARSAYELSRTPADAASAAMIRAHELRVRTALAAIPPGRVVRWAWLRHRAVGLGAIGLALALLLLATERGSSGAYALTHPGARNERGDRVAVAFADVEAHLVYPSYLNRPSVTVMDPTVLEVPRGTTVELRGRPRIDASGAAVRVAARDVPMERADDGRFVGRFVAREDGPLVLRLQRPDGEWIHDAADRAVRALPDEAPRVSLVQPSEDLIVDRPDPIDLRWDASDDVGIAHVDLVVRAPGGEESRRRVGSYEDGSQPMLANGTAPFDLALLAARPGDAFTVWLEARDGDVVSGPNLGRSSEVTITLASEAMRRDENLEALEGLLDVVLDALAARLERDVPAEPEPARARFEAVRGPAETFANQLQLHGERARVTGDTNGSERALFAEMATRVRRLLREERLAHDRAVAPLPERTAIDARAVTDLEDDALTLDDLLGRARVEDAAALARELEALRREIHSLLSELTRTDSPEARQQLLAAIGRAQARMRELAQRIAEMGTSVPQEFMNAGGEMPTQESSDTLADLREAVEQGNLQLADRLIGELSRQIDQLARALGQTEESFVESRFGPRERALADAMEALGGLEAEQGQLSRRGTERRSRAAQRALETLGGRDPRATRRLADQAEAVRSALEQIDRSGLAAFEQDVYDRARQRLVDTQDALRTGDLGEARRMAEAAAQDVSGLSRDLGLSALMFPGHQGETSADARQAREADRQLRELRRALDEALPDVASHVDPRDRGQMREDQARQRQARQATERLATQFDEGPDQAPLHDDAGRELRQAAQDMQRAADALERGDPLESARLQEEAARRLSELRERLEQESRGGGGGGGGESGESSPDFRRPVDIPDADQFEGPMEMRRRLLDAMRESAPRGYEEAVRRYYEGLLR
jgi:hypothetical protein